MFVNILQFYSFKIPSPSLIFKTISWYQFVSCFVLFLYIFLFHNFKLALFSYLEEFSGKFILGFVGLNKAAKCELQESQTRFLLKAFLNKLCHFRSCCQWQQAQRTVFKLVHSSCLTSRGWYD